MSNDTIVIYGLGEQAKAILHYIFKLTNLSVITVDLKSYEVNPLYASRWKHLKSSRGAPYVFDTINKELGEKKTTIINCLPTEYIVEATDLAIRYGYNMVDLGGEVSIEMEQIKLHDQAVKSGSTIIRAAGLAPGITTSFIINRIGKYGNELIGILIYCGVIPKYPLPPLYYSRSFNESGVIKECTGIAEVIRDGRVEYIPALSESEMVFIPTFGLLEADVTTGGLSTSVHDVCTDLKDISYKTLRYPGHFDYLRKNVLSQPNPEYVLSKVIDPISFMNPDVAVLRIDTITKSGIEHEVYFWEYDYGLRLSAMSRATGYVAADVALAVHDGMDPGVFNMGLFDPYVIRENVRRLGEGRNFSTEFIDY